MFTMHYGPIMHCEHTESHIESTEYSINQSEFQYISFYFYLI